MGPDLIGLVTTRDEIKDLLILDDVIDLVIPRGSNALVNHIKSNTKIAVLGHAGLRIPLEVACCNRAIRRYASTLTTCGSPPLTPHPLSDGVCHVYVDRKADLAMAEALALDAKMDYPAACNAMVRGGGGTGGEGNGGNVHLSRRTARCLAASRSVTHDWPSSEV